MRVELPDRSPGTGAPSSPVQWCLDSFPELDLLTGLLVTQVRAWPWLDAFLAAWPAPARRPVAEARWRR
jgi:hypothetical protein